MTTPRGWREQLILLGRYDEAATEPPEFEVGDLVQLARWVRDRAGRGRLCPDPIHYARKLQIRVIDRVPQGAPPECCDGEEIRFRWHHQRRTRGTRVAHGLAHCVLVKVGWGRHTEADAWMLAAELLVPSELVLRRHTVDQLFDLAQHAERWVIEAQVMAGLIRARAA